ncbi:hypothetical protein E2P81_ATG08286 [Venturia nashicola]|uniref:Uncharacterized protein n=1 Tax=Venturia nashicola TaxID=86259 RepID=A0A4Z1NQD5_9PEZI|nr:hypothetical protein E6O75_ATG08468 [Venturia nashicola]TLD21698.1 hypothetical protein E2P81_ATG08286 [Venturia nashicola]
MGCLVVVDDAESWLLSELVLGPFLVETRCQQPPQPPQRYHAWLADYADVPSRFSPPRHPPLLVMRKTWARDSREEPTGTDKFVSCLPAIIRVFTTAASVSSRKMIAWNHGSATMPVLSIAGHTEQAHPRRLGMGMAMGMAIGMQWEWQSECNGNGNRNAMGMAIGMQSEWQSECNRNAIGMAIGMGLPSHAHMLTSSTVRQ